MHTSNGYLELMPPALVNSESLHWIWSAYLNFQMKVLSVLMTTCGFLPLLKFHLTAFHRNDIIDSKQLLPLSMLHIAHVSGEKLEVMEGIQKV